VEFDCQNTLDRLAGSSIKCPPVSSKLLSTYLSYYVSSGFIETPQQNDKGHYLNEAFGAVSKVV
jgi:hypothetical protein